MRFLKKDSKALRAVYHQVGHIGRIKTESRKYRISPRIKGGDTYFIEASSAAQAAELHFKEDLNLVNNHGSYAVAVLKDGRRYTVTSVKPY